ncbi:MAG: SGNH/GDSL hydrolase family protein [Deltaproteobacteria bacterium]|nr:SGNH/GDSL hydrolase family protein [Deltaproteobacteria bacterium]
MNMRWIRVLAVGCGLLTGCGTSDAGDGMSGESEDGTTGATGMPATDAGTTMPASGSGMDPDDTGMDTGSVPTTTGTPPDDDTSTGGGEGVCQPPPARMVVLGDSIAACFGVGGVDSSDCAPRLVADYLDQNVGPVVYQNLSVSGAVTTDVSQSQIFNVEVGMPGHVFVMIYIGGNDLAQYIFLSDQAALDGWNNTTGPVVAQAWEEILDFFGDEANFPDGVTLMMNTQYNPFDDCTAAPYFVSETKIMLLHQHNDALTERANSRQWAFIADQHPSYLGHGHYVNDSGCPHYDASFDGWMNDLIHPNAAGHTHLADVMIETAQQQVYSCEE